jgi:hypothetical protein
MVWKDIENRGDGASEEVAALLMNGESGSAFTLLYPDFEVVIPDRPSSSVVTPKDRPFLARQARDLFDAFHDRTEHSRCWRAAASEDSR